MKKTMYQISKLAREISEYLDLTMIVVWDILNELNFEPQELTEKEVMKWTTKVEKRIMEEQKSLHMIY